MARFEDSPGLFGSGVGGRFYGQVRCGWCQTLYGEPDNIEGTSTHGGINVAHLGSLEVCECCFEEIERVFLSRMDDILPWFTRIVAARRKMVERHEELIANLKEALNQK